MFRRVLVLNASLKQSQKRIYPVFRAFSESKQGKVNKSEKMSEEDLEEEISDILGPVRFVLIIIKF